MWTPRRLGLLAIGFVAYLLLYLGYSRTFLGAIDGLPALPPEYAKPPEGQVIGEPDDRPQQTKLDTKLKMAFGENCDELTRPIKLELHSKRMLLAADDFAVINGKVRLRPLSVAIFGQDKGDGKVPEINTIRGEVAHLEFDRPVATLQEISGRKIIAAELEGKIQIVNNRRTAERFDDLTVNIARGPLYYSEAKHLVWTHDHVFLNDAQSRPPNEVRGHGMEMHLLTDAPAPAPGRPAPLKKSQDTISGVKKIILQSDVDMYLYVNGKSGFMNNHDQADNKKVALKGDTETKAHAAVKPEDAAGHKRASDKQSQPMGPDQPLRQNTFNQAMINLGEAQAKNQKNAQPVEPDEKAQIHITTPGRFVYQFGNDKDAYDVARFDVAVGGQAARAPQDVVVVRRQPKVPGEDRLFCEHLELRIKHKSSDSHKEGGKPAAVRPAPQEPEQGLDIETVHATGAEVTLTSDAEKLEAHCVELIYEAPTSTTTLKGNPKMRAVREGTEILCREMQIKEIKQPDAKDNQPQRFSQVLAYGPGQIDMLDKNTNKRTLHALWSESLTSTRDGPYDLLVLNGEARFLDDEHDQLLQADTLKVWLEEKKADPKAPQPAPTGDKNATQQSHRPNHLEALGNVLAKSKELHIHDTSRLVVWFKDVPEEALLTPPPQKTAATAPTGKGVPAARSQAPSTVREAPDGPAVQPQPAPDKPSAGPSLARPGEPDKKDAPRPIDLSARTVEAWVLRSEIRNTLDKLWTEGTVHVQQEPAKPDEKGVDIRGDTLTMNYHPEGNLLVVTGNDVAQLQMDKIYIIGPEVNIDQAANKAWVTGCGAMMMESNTSLAGNKMEKAKPLTVHWNNSMLFVGKWAEFHGDIQADQGNGRLACQSLQVFFDRPISLKEGNKSDQPAHVQNLICDRAVRIEEAEMEGDKLQKYQLLIASSVAVDTIRDSEEGPPGTANKETSEVRASGPGSVRIFQRGGADPLAPPTEGAKPPPQAKPGQEGEMKLTYVTFLNNMYANNKTNTAIFRGNVRTLNMPSDTPHKEINMDTMLENMPKEAMFLSCDQLTVLTRKENGKTWQEMEAKQRVMVQSKVYWGRCVKLTYNEAKDQIIFHGSDTELARLYRVINPGAPPEEIRGRKIIYIRSTGAFTVEGGDGINGRG